MKNFLILTYILLSFLSVSIQSSFAQSSKVIDQTEIQVNYLYTYQEDSLSSSSLKTDEMTLYMGKNYSLFEHRGRYYRDSLVLAHKNDEGATLTVLSKLKSQPSGSHLSKFKVLKSQKSNTTIIYEGPVNINNYISVKEEIKFNWQLVSNTDSVINSYKCHMAKTYFAGRNYTAWYTTEIPINDGPYKFKGLPGLIIKVYDSKQQHIFELSSISDTQYKRPIYFDETLYQELNCMQDYYKIKQSEFNTISNLISSGKVKTNADIGELNAKLLSKNNYIEKL